MASDVIEREIFINASIERVWSLVSKTGWWVGEVLHFDHEAGVGEQVTIDVPNYGSYPVDVLTLDAPRYAAYRWSSGFPGEILDDQNSTLVEFTLLEQNGGVVVQLKESGFASIRNGDEDYKENSKGWDGQLAALIKVAEQVGVS